MQTKDDMMSSADRAPIVDALLAYARRNPSSFHVPGHKRGQAYLQDSMVASWLGAIGAFDATELPGLDDLHWPEAAILEAQQLAAECFGSERTFFLVGGSTVGNLAMIHSLCRPGDIVLMQRNAHKSAIHALMLAQAGAVFLPPVSDEPSGLYTAPSEKLIDEQLEKFPEAKAVFITNPNYYGMSADVRAIADIVHKHGKPLLVDEAHGAHFGFDPSFPESALECGADVVVQSTHKMLPAMTMGSMLHVQGERVNSKALEHRLRILQSSSPSYPILASLDWARSKVHGVANRDAFQAGLEAVRLIHESLETSSSRFGFIKQTASSAYIRIDPFKLTIYDKAGILSGFQLQSLLYEYGCDAEMADDMHVLLAMGMNSTKQDAKKLKAALIEIELRYSAEKQENVQKKANIRSIWPNVSPQPVYFDANGVISASRTEGRSERVSIEASPGAISAEMVIPYPPGIPLLYPGELITPATVQALAGYRDKGAAVQGISDKTLRSILVWAGNNI